MTTIKRSDILPREGIVLDTFLKLFYKTLLNPTLTIPLLLWLRHTRRGRDIAYKNDNNVERLKKLIQLGVLTRLGKMMSWGARNNWVTDQYVWDREIAVVTGGSGGIGGHVARGLAEKGLKVVVLDVIALTYDAPRNLHYYKVDLTKTADLAKIAEDIRATIGNPTILVNNAGVARGKTILDSTEQDIRFTFDVNTISHYWTVKEFLPDMIKNDHGHIVTVASIAAYVGAPQLVDYAASKAAALSFHEGLGMELKMRYNAPKVRTSLVTQGFTRTPLFAGWQNDSKYIFPSLYPETVADGIVDQILTGDSGHVMLPKAFDLFLPGSRGWPDWMSSKLRDTTYKLMSNWQGRQVIDPNQSESDESKHIESSGSDPEEVTDDQSKSTVLV